ncbi:MAG: hypothetical protein Q8M71_04565 [Thermodesulfovibrionales bacterium]|nr:hypothetical protein [Thermodesulfovibrionales bacterium]
MSRVLDLDKKESEWHSVIDKLKRKIQEYDKTIQEAQSSKQQTIDEIEKYSRWIHTAREMYGLNTSDLGEKIDTAGKAESRADLILKKFDELKIPDAVKKALSESTKKRLTIKELTKLLLEGGIKTSSADFHNVMQNRLSSLAKQGTLTVEKEGRKNYYSLSQTKN